MTSAMSARLAAIRVYVIGCTFLCTLLNCDRNGLGQLSRCSISIRNEQSVVRFGLRPKPDNVRFTGVQLQAM